MIREQVGGYSTKKVTEENRRLLGVQSKRRNSVEVTNLFNLYYYCNNKIKISYWYRLNEKVN